MTRRVLLELALCVLGLWQVITQLFSLISLAVMCLSGYFGAGPYDSMMGAIWVSAITSLLQGLLGFALIVSAPRIAAWFYPPHDEEPTLTLSIGPGDVYHVTCFGLGVYLLVGAANPLSQLVALAMDNSPAMLGAMIGNIVTALVQVAAGIFLIFGSKWLGTLVANLRYDPDTIPKQQFSLALVVGLIFVCAVILGLIRLLVRGGI